MQEVLGEEGEAGSCEDEMTATEPSPAEAEAELPELQSQVRMSFVFLTVLLNHCCHLACMRVIVKHLQRPCLPRTKNLLLLFPPRKAVLYECR